MQTNLVRAAVAVASVAVLVVLFVVLSTGDEESGEPTGEPAATTTTTELPGESREGRPAQEQERRPEPAVPTLVAAGGQPRDGVTELEFDAGEQIRFDVRSDVAEEIHVHGYDVYADLRPGRAAKLRFPAELEGVFEVELHGSGALLAELVVKP